MSIERNLVCTGCGACVRSCPVNCIDMVCNVQGWYVPSIDKDKCVRCGKCEKHCPVLNAQVNNDPAPDAFAAYSKDDSVRDKSSSGGIFTEIAKQVIAEGGIVYGAYMDDTLCVRHIGISRVEDICKLVGSKYVQSQTDELFPQIKKELDDGRLIYYSGTPCQVEGLLSFLGKKYSNLLTQDLICHGVPAPKLWDNYVQYVSRKRKATTPCGADFRNKKNGWRDYSMKIEFKDGKSYVNSRFSDPYLLAFAKNYILRDSCYQCPFKTLQRRSDITLADFWPAKAMVPDMDDNVGLSLVFAHTDNGRKLIKKISSNCVMREVDANEISERIDIGGQVQRPENREKFIQDIMESNDWKNVRKKYIQIPLTEVLKKRIRTIINGVKRRW